MMAMEMMIAAICKYLGTNPEKMKAQAIEMHGLALAVMEDFIEMKASQYRTEAALQRIEMALHVANGGFPDLHDDRLLEYCDLGKENKGN